MAQSEARRDGIAWGVLDLSGVYRRNFDVALPEVGQVADPLHVVRLASNSIDGRGERRLCRLSAIRDQLKQA